MTDHAGPTIFRCDRCGKFTRHLHPIYTSPPEGGIDHDECCRCRHPDTSPCAGPQVSDEDRKQEQR